MWKYIKGTEKDFEGLPEETQYILKDSYWNSILYYMIKNEELFVSYKDNTVWSKSNHKNIAVAVLEEDGIITAQREWVEEPVVKPEEQQTLPTKEQINIAGAMEQSSTPRIGSMMHPAKDLPKIKLDVKKPVFNINDDKEVKFIYSNKREYVFEDHQGLILVTMNEYLDSNYYNKPDVKTTEQLISDAWTHACNDGSLWASPTQLYYIAIKELIKHNVIDVSKIHEVSDDTNK